MDFRFACRSLLKSPGFTILAVLVLALGIGANSALFTVVNSVLLKPLAYKNPERIVSIATQWRNNGTLGMVSAPDFHDWHDQSNSFEAMSYYVRWETSAIVNGHADYVQAAGIAPEFFRVLGAQAVLGRTFTPQDEAGQITGVVISSRFWRRNFAGDPKVLGKIVKLRNTDFTVIGVTPPAINFPEQTDIWYPMWIVGESSSRTAHNYRVVARLKNGVPVAQAQNEMTAIGDRISQQYPVENGKKSVGVSSLQDQMVGNVRDMLYVLLGAVGLVLLIACANVANLLLARATARTREIAIRTAVGATRSRILRQLTTESLVLGAVAGIAGLIVSVWCVDGLIALSPADIPRLGEVSLDWRVLLFTLAVSLASSVLFGLAPAFTASKVDVSDALKQGARSASGAQGGRMRSVLVVGEIAVSMVLIVGAGLLIRSFLALEDVDWGIKPDHLLVAQTTIPANNVADARRATAIYADLVPKLASLPGVMSLAGTEWLPGGVGSNGGYWLEGGPGPEVTGSNTAQAVKGVVTTGYFRTMGISLRDGRDFTARDGYDAPRVCIVNEALAKKSFGGQSPIGKRIRSGMDVESLKYMEIVGVVADVHEWGASRDPWPMVYMPFEQHPSYATQLRIVAHTSGEPMQLSETMRRQIRQANPDIAVRFSTMESRVSDSLATPRFRTMLLGGFAVVALMLALAGVYGVMAYSVSRRSAEIGLRMALGAQPGEVLRMILAQGFKLAAIGVPLGLAGAYGASRLLSSMLFHVKPADPLTYVAVAALITIVTVLAGWIPAMRAAHLDPVQALRQE